MAAIRLGPTGIPRTWGLVCHGHHPLPAAVRELVSLLAETLPPRFALAATA